MATAMLFGAVHALMPGHGKIVLMSYHLGQPSSPTAAFTNGAILALNACRTGSGARPGRVRGHQQGVRLHIMGWDIENDGFGVVLSNSDPSGWSAKCQWGTCEYLHHTQRMMTPQRVSSDPRRLQGGEDLSASLRARSLRDQGQSPLRREATTCCRSRATHRVRC